MYVYHFRLAVLQSLLGLSHYKKAFINSTTTGGGVVYVYQFAWLSSISVEIILQELLKGIIYIL